MYYIHACIMLLFVDCGYMVGSLESEIILRNFGCQNDGNLFKRTVYRYSSVSIIDVFTSKNVLNSVLQLLSTGDIVRVAGHGLFSPDYTFNGCFNLTQQYWHNGSNLNVTKFANQINGSMHGCFRGCTPNLVMTHHIFVGLSLTTCYCIHTDNLDSVSFVDNKLCDKTDLKSSNNTYGKYIYLYSSEKNKEFFAVYKYDAHFQLCKYAVSSSWGINKLYSRCNLPVEGVVCGYSDTPSIDQNFKQITQRNSSNVKGLCDGEKHVNELKVDDLDFYFKRFDKDLFMLRHYRDLFIRNSTYNGSDCVSLKRDGDNLFVQAEACVVNRKYVCKEVDFMSMMVQYGFILFGVFCSICVLICVVAMFYARKHYKRSPKQPNVRELYDRTATDDNDEKLSDGATECFVMESLHDGDSVEGRLNQGGAVWGRMNKGGAVWGRMNKGGAVWGRMNNGGAVSGRMNNGGAVSGRMSNGGAVLGRSADGGAVSGRLNNGGAVSGRLGKWMAALNILRVFGKESDS